MNNLKYVFRSGTALFLGFGCLVALLAYRQFGSQVVGCAASTIKKISFFEEAKINLENADQNTLILFDIDATLIIPSDVVMRDQTMSLHGPEIEQLRKSVFGDEEETLNYYFEIWEHSPHAFRLIEPGVVSLIQALQQRGVKVLALSTGNFIARYPIVDFPQFRSKMLQDLGIDFSKVDLPDTVFDSLPTCHGTKPLLYQGILCSEQVSKGVVLGAFLDYMVWKPNRVVFFDDQFINVSSVARELCQRGIPFTGYHYLGAEKVSGKWDPARALQQFEYLKHHSKWLSDAQIVT